MESPFEEGNYIAAHPCCLSWQEHKASLSLEWTVQAKRISEVTYNWTQMEVKRKNQKCWNKV